ncbi:DUF945 family protein [Vibrio sinaloensis]|uniref:DUF945 family protein n=1 Tax=Photobacterium sp. (strain ATCC 43367) TaxID=379097 RepID=UPI00206EA63A|nr:DUF945 family protein [Vibrio sinaloensis]UPQ88938.1 DUF945 family protein [Vibrio sinaloensis]
MELKKLGAIGGAITLALCWPLAVGQIGQSVIQDGVTHLNNESLKAEVLEYDRGYLSSQVTTRYIVTDPLLAEQLTQDGLPTEFVVNSQVSHGLMSISAVSQLANAPDFPLTLETVTQLNGNTDYRLKLDNWNQTTQGTDGFMLSVSPATLSGEVTVLGEMTYQLDAPSIQLDFNSGEKMMVSGIYGEGQGKKVDSFWIGEQTLKVEQASVSNADQQTLFSLDNSQYRFISALDEVAKTVSSQHIVELNNVVTTDGEVEQVSLDLAFGDLDSVAFEQLVNIYQNNPVPSNQDIQTAIPYVDRLFANGFYVAINEMVVKLTEESRFQTQWTIQVPKGTDDVTQNMAKILPALTGDIDTFVSNGLVADYPFVRQGVDEAMVMEIMQQSELGYRMKAQLLEGNLVFENGQEIPLMALLLPMLMQP